MRKMRIDWLFVVLALFTPGAHAQATYKVLYNFGTNAADPINPQYLDVIAQGRDGNLYSTAFSGGTNGDGAMFKVTPSGTLTVPYNFDSTDAACFSGLTLGTDGNFYGTTVGGGTSNMGTVFKITPAGTVTLLHSFLGSDGNYAYAPPIQGKDGNFYGTTVEGGTNSVGTVYKITPSGQFTSLYSFDGTHGDYPFAPLVQGTDGNFYGTTEQGGAIPAYGVVYRITASGKLTVIYNFDGTHGGQPLSPVVQGSDGNFYGTTTSYGSKGHGVVFKTTPSGKLTVLHNINGTTDGNEAIAGLVQATDGNLYGTTQQGGSSTNCSSGCGTIFKISPIQPYPYKVLYNFDLTTGQSPSVTLVQHTNGTLYGDTQMGGTGNVSPCTVGACGVFYSLNIGAAPFVSLVTTSGKVGKTVEILGQGFTGTKGVSFNGTAASFKVSSNTYLTATVPTGATTGPVTVTTPGGTLTSSKIFRVTPQITSFSPTSGPVGTVVTITGVSLKQTTKVTFGGVKATTVTVVNDTQVKATVPSGAVTGKIAITTPGGKAVSSGVFTVT